MRTVLNILRKERRRCESGEEAELADTSVHNRLAADSCGAALAADCCSSNGALVADVGRTFLVWPVPSPIAAISPGPVPGGVKLSNIIAIMIMEWSVSNRSWCWISFEHCGFLFGASVALQGTSRVNGRKLQSSLKLSVWYSWNYEPRSVVFCFVLY